MSKELKRPKVKDYHAGEGTKYRFDLNNYIDQLESKLKEAEKENKAMFLNMQYYMEHCRRDGYCTPQDWIEKHKHF